MQKHNQKNHDKAGIIELDHSHKQFPIIICCKYLKKSSRRERILLKLWKISEKILCCNKTGTNNEQQIIHL